MGPPIEISPPGSDPSPQIPGALPGQPVIPSPRVPAFPDMPETPLEPEEPKPEPKEPDTPLTPHEE